MDSEQTTPSLSQAQRMKKFSKEGRLSKDMMVGILSEEKKPEQEKVTLDGATLHRYFPQSYTPQRMQEVILKLLEGWQRKREQER
jgi:ParB family chromosome partitioning protein